jgi:hypothetical protein
MYRTAIALVLFGLSVLSEQLTAQERALWVFFTDKPAVSTVRGAVTPEMCGLSATAVERRSIALHGGPVVDMADLPVNSSYVDALKSLGAKVRVVSRWLNAASVSVAASVIPALKKLPFVASVRPVGARRTPREVMKSIPPMARTQSTAAHELSYGESLGQLELCNVPKVHDVWFDGTGAVSGMLDNGFAWRVHESLKNLEVRGEYDFIFKDTITQNQIEDTYAQDEHGTCTLSAFAGYLPGKLIGPAFKSAFWLAKTEDNRSETQVEEDYWVEGIEWLESKGVAVVNSSLGYLDFDDGTMYNWAAGDLNGRTEPASIAAARAARFGVAVVSSMGNEGDHQGSICSPADADSIISVGAIHSTGQLASFSSNGPTSDRRIKPDVVNQGVAVYCASKYTDSAYQYASGTSLSSPLTAGVAALVRSARPEMTVLELRDALRMTANNASSPNSRYGWGLVNAWDALLYHGLVISTGPRVFWTGSSNVVAAWVLSRKSVKRDSVFITYSLDGGADQTLAMEFIASHLDLNSTSGLYYARLPEIPLNTVVRYYITASDEKERRTMPYLAPGERRSFVAGTTNTIGSEHLITPGFWVSPSFPNPYSSAAGQPVQIEFNLPESAHVTVDMYDMLGRRIASILNADMDRGIHSARWLPAHPSAGVYFYHVTAGSHEVVKRMVIVH